jgi:redox-sensitive bicupin YhaK (pirin superfamily)
MSPMITVRRSDARGKADRGWLTSRFTFSFADYVDPHFSGFRVLKVMNEDTIAPGQGFGPHAHRDMEIITFVLEGTLRHRDSLSGTHLVGPNEIQTMSAGTGVVHAEFNASEKDPVHLMQIWIEPEAEDLPPAYQQVSIPAASKRGRLCLLAGPRGGRDVPLTTINQDARVYVAELASGDSLEYALAPDRHAWVQVVQGQASLNSERLTAGDGAAVSTERALVITGQGAVGGEVLVFDLP